MEFIKTDIEGVVLIRPVKHGDARGYFMETFKQAEFDAAIPGVNFVQANESLSSRGVLRGLHMQLGEWSQAKLVRVSRGKVVDVAVDMRPDSPTFGRHIAVELSEENAMQMFVPRGFAHGFIVLCDIAQFQYRVDNVYAPQAEITIRFDDPTLAVNWPDPGCELLLSARDSGALSFGQALELIKQGSK